MVHQASYLMKQSVFMTKEKNMRESTKNTISMLSDMWKRNSPMADFDAFALVCEIADAYHNDTVSAESCMDEILALVIAKDISTKERFDNMQKVISDE
jgi:hypothetical protein